jgi:hypothetical protein
MSLDNSQKDGMIPSSLGKEVVMGEEVEDTGDEVDIGKKRKRLAIDTPSTTATAEARKASHTFSVALGHTGELHQREIRKNLPRMETKEFGKSRTFFLGTDGMIKGILKEFCSKIATFGDESWSSSINLSELIRLRHRSVTADVDNKKGEFQEKILSLERILEVELHLRIWQDEKEEYTLSPQWKDSVAKMEKYLGEASRLEIELEKMMDVEGPAKKKARTSTIPRPMRKMHVPHTPKSTKFRFGPAVRMSPIDPGAPLIFFKADPARARLAMKKRMKKAASSKTPTTPPTISSSLPKPTTPAMPTQPTPSPQIPTTPTIPTPPPPSQQIPTPPRTPLCRSIS